jgi:uncharacterized membrane-anchored protein YitT (DUF2179 family)
MRIKYSGRTYAKSFAFILIGIFSAAFGLEGFIIPNGLIDGGVTGISLLVSKLTHFSLPILIVLINLPFILIGYKQVSAAFAAITAIGIAALSAVLIFVPFPIITNDYLLAAVFGGLFLGGGIGMCIRGGGVIDGTEVLSILISRKTGFTIGDLILIFNILIFSVAAFFMKIEFVLYSLLTYLSASKTVDYIVQGIEEYTGVTIISSKSNEIRLAIIEDLGRGVTVLKGSGGYGKRGQNMVEIDVLFCVTTRLEIQKLKSLITTIDSSAFVVMHSINDSVGGMLKKRPLHH